MDDPEPSSAPAGWYPDPHAQHELRWWDGSVWSDHTHDDAPSPAASPAAATAHPTVGPLYWSQAAALGGATMVVASFLTWFAIGVGMDSESVTGLQHDADVWTLGFANGWIPLIGGVIAVLVAVRQTLRDSPAAHSWLVGIGAVGAVWSVLSYITVTANIRDGINDRLTGQGQSFEAFGRAMVDVQTGLGVWLSGAGAVMVLLAANTARRASASH